VASALLVLLVLLVLLLEPVATLRQDEHIVTTHTGEKSEVVHSAMTRDTPASNVRQGSSSNRGTTLPRDRQLVTMSLLLVANSMSFASQNPAFDDTTKHYETIAEVMC